jgi:outer membrane protein assembly factor BamB
MTLIGWTSILCLTFFGNAISAEWAGFRGPNSSGVASEGNPPISFGAGTNLVFKADAPPGASSPCVWANRIFLTAQVGTHLQTLCLDANTGVILWTKVAPGDRLEAFHPSEGSPAASTPATDGQHVVSFFGSRGVFCYDLAGNEKWHYSAEPAAHIGAFGTGSSPLLANGLVLVNRDQAAGSKLLALKLETGEVAWEAARPELVSSYSTPVIWDHDGQLQVVVAGSLQLRSYDLKTGAEIWRVRGLPAVVCTTPVVGNGMLIFAGWSNGKAENALESFDQLLKDLDKNANGSVSEDEFKSHYKFPTFFVTFDADSNQKIERQEWEGVTEFLSKGENCLIAVRPGKGDITDANVLWKQTRGLPYVPSPLSYKGHVYLVKDGGLVSCFDAASGEPVYLQERLGSAGSYYSSPVAADNRIYMASVDGKITVIRSGANPEVIGRSDLAERLVTTPAIVGRSLFIRTATHLWRFQQKPKPGA